MSWALGTFRCAVAENRFRGLSAGTRSDPTSHPLPGCASPRGVSRVTLASERRDGLRLALATWTRTLKPAPGMAADRDGRETDRTTRSGRGGVRRLAPAPTGSTAKQESTSAGAP